MKKFFILCLMALVMCVNVNAQEREVTPTDSEHLNEISNSIELIEYDLQSPNSVGGCDMYIEYKNITKNKVMKYVIFECRYYNAVDDVVYCDIRGYSTFRGKVTGPIEYMKKDRCFWDCPIYNWSARKMEIIGIEIDYMDGTKLNIGSEEMKYVKGYRGRK